MPRTPSPLHFSKVSPKRPALCHSSERRTWGTDTLKHMLMVTSYPDNNTEREIKPSSPHAHWSVHYAKGALSRWRGRACRKRYLRAHYRTVHHRICILHKARDGARRYTLNMAQTSRGNTEPSPRPIRSLLEGGPQGRVCPISLPCYDTTFSPTSISHPEQISFEWLLISQTAEPFLSSASTLFLP